MPIYEYVCKLCGKELEQLQKMSDAPLSHCPACGAEDGLRKKISSAGFQLKGTGWYVTDFKDKKDASSASVEKTGSTSSESS